MSLRGNMQTLKLEEEITEIYELIWIYKSEKSMRDILNKHSPEELLKPSIVLEINTHIDRSKICEYFSVLLMFDKVQLILNNIRQFEDFCNFLKINYKGFYGWQKVREIFVDTFQPEDDHEKQIVQKIQSLSLPSTFEIPSNWIIYAPISR